MPNSKLLSSQPRGFSWLVGGNLLYKVASGVHEFLFITLAIAFSGNSSWQIGFLYFLRLTPYLLASPSAGLATDRADKVLLLRLSVAIRLVVSAIFAAILWGGAGNMATLAIYGGGISISRVMYGAPYTSAVIDFVNRDRLLAANGINQIATELGMMIGPLIATLLYANAFPYLALVILEMGFVAGALLLLFRPKRGDLSLSFAAFKTSATDFSSFYFPPASSLATNKAKQHILLAGLCIFFVGGTLGILVPQAAATLPQGGAAVGLVMASLSFGALGSSLLYPMITSTVGTISMSIGWAAYGGVLALFPLLNGSIPTICAWAILLGGLGALVDIILPTIIQSESEQQEVGHNFSFFSSIANVGDSLSGPTLGWLGAMIGIAPSIAISGLLVCMIASVGYFILRRLGSTV